MNHRFLSDDINKYWKYAVIQELDILNYEEKVFSNYYASFAFSVFSLNDYNEKQIKLISKDIYTSAYIAAISLSLELDSPYLMHCLFSSWKNIMKSSKEFHLETSYSIESKVNLHNSIFFEKVLFNDENTNLSSDVINIDHPYFYGIKKYCEQENTWDNLKEISKAESMALETLKAYFLNKQK